MNFENVLMHNLGALEQAPGLNGHKLVRVPTEIRNRLNDGAKLVGMDSVGIEIQFVTDAPCVDVYLSTQNPCDVAVGHVKVFRGNFLHQTLEIAPGVANCFRISPPASMETVNDDISYKNGFSPKVWRVVCDRTTVVFSGVNTFGYPIRKPNPQELPKLNWLAYGSSITNSSLDGYPHIAARKLGMQVQNLGLSGSCHIEKDLVDYMFDCRSFDFITCELGVNMRGIFSPAQFRERAQYLIDRIVQSKKPAIIISIFPNCKSPAYATDNTLTTECEQAYNDILEEITKNVAPIMFVRGEELLTDVNGLSSDLLHPSSYGHAIMGLNLAEKIQTLMKSSSTAEL